MIRISPLLALAGALYLLLALPAPRRPPEGAPHPALRLARRLLRHRLPAHRPGRGHNTRNGFAYQLPGLAKPRGYNFKLVNFGCGGATTTRSSRRRAACRAPARSAARSTRTRRRPPRPRLPARAPREGRPDHRVDRRQRRHDCASAGRPDRLRRRGGQGDQGRTSPSSPSGCARRPARRCGSSASPTRT